MPTIARDGDVAVLNLGGDENRFSPDWLESMHACLDEIEGLGSPAALVTVAEGKFWSNGLDLDGLKRELKCGTSCGSCVPEIKRLLVTQVAAVAVEA